MKIRGQKLTRQERDAIKVCLRGRCNGATFDASSRLVTVQMDAFGGDRRSTDPTAKPQTVSEVPVAFPYGFLSMLPAGDAYEPEILETAGGLLCVSSRSALPSACPAPAEGDSIQYSSGGSYTHHDADGDTILEPNSGKVVIIGNGRGHEAIVVDGDECKSNATFDTWASNVEAGILAAGGGAVVPPWSTGAAMADAEASTTKARAE